MHIQLFGQPTIAQQNKPSVHLQPDKVTALLVYLAAHVGQPVPRIQLAGLLWGGYPDKDARRNLTNTLSRLKKVLQRLAPSQVALFATTRQTVMLTVDHVTVDAQQFDQQWALCATINRALWATDPDAITQLTTLATLYRGPFADGLWLSDCVEFEAWAARKAEQYRQQTLTGLEHLTAYHLAQGQLDSAEPFARRQLEIEPSREVAHRQLIQRYLAAGQRSAAVAQFERCKRVLWEELDAEPSVETAALLKQSVAQAHPTKKDQPAVPTRRRASRQKQGSGRPSRRRRTQLAELSAFFGRESELAQLQQLIEDPATRLITLHGEGGIGKTRLAQAAGERFSAEFADGIRFVQLVGISDPAAITSAIIETLGLQLQGKRDPFDQLCDYLQDQQLLLILDNLEHLLTFDEETVVDQLLDLLDAASDLLLLVTSRQRIWLQIERVVRLVGLPFPPIVAEGEPRDMDNTWRQFESVQLFVARIQQSNPHFDPQTAREPIIQICQLVQGLPLGVELAAAQSTTWSCEKVAEALTRGMELSTRMRDIPKRQRSLMTVFNHSWELLEKEFRPILAQAAIMRGDFSYEAFHAITDGSHADLETLVAHALIRQTDEGRFDIHEMVRQFALTRLSQNKLQIAQTRHLTYFLTFIASREQSILSESELSALSIRKEWGHIEQAWLWALAQQAFDRLHNAIQALCNYWYVGGLAATTLGLLATTQAHITPYVQSRPLAKKLKMDVHGLQIWVGLNTTSSDFVRECIKTVLDETNRQLSPSATVIALSVHGLILFASGRYARAVQTLENSTRLAKQHQIDLWQLTNARICTMAFANAERLQEAEQSAERIYALTLHQKSAFYQDQALNQLAWLQVWKWELSAGIAQFEQNLKLRSERMQTRRVNLATTTLATAYYKVGAFEQVSKILYLAEQPKVRDSHTQLNTAGYYVLSRAKRREGKIDQAIEYGQLAVERTNRLGAGMYHLWSRTVLGLALCAASRFGEAQAVLLEAQRRMKESEATDSWFILIEGTLAYSYAAAGDRHTAYQLVDKLYAKLVAADPIYTHLEQTWYCYQILDHDNDPRAANLLQHARHVLNDRAAKLTPQHRQSFLNNFPEHRQIMALTNNP